MYSKLVFSFRLPSKDNILSAFLTKNREFLEFLKSLFKTSGIQNLDYENNFTVLCTSERGQMIKLNKKPTNKNFKFEGVLFFLTLRIQLAENANKSYHDYTVIVVLHIYNKTLGTRLAGYPEIKNKCATRWPLDIFEEYSVPIGSLIGSLLESASESDSKSNEV